MPSINQVRVQPKTGATTFDSSNLVTTAPPNSGSSSSSSSSSSSDASLSNDTLQQLLSVVATSAGQVSIEGILSSLLTATTQSDQSAVVTALTSILNAVSTAANQTSQETTLASILSTVSTAANQTTMETTLTSLLNSVATAAHQTSMTTILSQIATNTSGGISGGGGDITIGDVRFSGSTGTDWSANPSAIPIDGYELLTTIPANANRNYVEVQNQSEHVVQIVRDDGTGGNQTTILLAPGSTSDAGQQGAGWSSGTFQGRIKIYSSSASDQVAAYED